MAGENRRKQKDDPARSSHRAARRGAGSTARPTVDRPLAAALDNPLRARILTAIDRRPLSPSEIATQCGEPVAKIAYHFKVLQECGCIVPSGKGRQLQGVERVYRRSAAGTDGGPAQA